MKLIEILLLLLGFVMLVKGADWFVDGTAGIAAKFGIPQLVIGLTIVAMGTSAPETAVSINAAIKQNAGISIGNVVGSNILNILIILGITAVLTTVAIQRTTFVYEIPFMIGVTVVLIVMGITGSTISRTEGIIMWILFFLYLVYLFFLAKNGAAEDIPVPSKASTLLLKAILGGILIVWGSDVTVDSATNIAIAAGLSERFIGLTIVALGTSLPELVTSVTAALKGNADIAIGNIVGSNIFNILFVLGTASLITPIPFEANFLIDSIIAVGVGILLWISVMRTKSLRRAWGILMLSCYAVYLGYLLL